MIRRGLRLNTVASLERKLKHWLGAVAQPGHMGAPREGTPLFDAADLMRRVIRREGADEAALRAHMSEFGRLCGNSGIDLADASYLVAALLPCADRRLRRLLDSRPIGIRVAAGWMAGRDERAVGLSTKGAISSVETLRLRIEQEGRQCRDLNVALGDAYALIVFEMTPFAASLDKVSAHDVATALAEHFTGGETIAICENGRVLALADMHRFDPSTIRFVGRSVEQALDVSPGSLRSWVEPLGFSLTHLPAHLSGLAA